MFGRPAQQWPSSRGGGLQAAHSGLWFIWKTAEKSKMNWDRLQEVQRFSGSACDGQSLCCGPFSWLLMFLQSLQKCKIGGLRAWITREGFQEKWRGRGGGVGKNKTYEGSWPVSEAERLKSLNSFMHGCCFRSWCLMWRRLSAGALSQVS